MEEKNLAGDALLPSRKFKGMQCYGYKRSALVTASWNQSVDCIAWDRQLQPETIQCVISNAQLLQGVKIFVSQHPPSDHIMRAKVNDMTAFLPSTVSPFDFPNLQRVRVQGPCDDQWLADLVSSHPKLTRLWLGRSPPTVSRLSKALAAAENLRSFTLDSSDLNVLSELALSMPYLDDFGFYTPRADGGFLAQHCPNLRVICMMGLVSESTMTTATLIGFIRNCPNLEIISCSVCVNDAVLFAIAARGLRLTELDAAWGVQGTAAVVRCAEAFRHITTFKLYSLITTDEEHAADAIGTLTQALGLMPHLRELASRMPSTAWRAIADARCCRNLRVLKASVVDCRDDRTVILTSLIRQNPLLESIAGLDDASDPNAVLVALGQCCRHCSQVQLSNRRPVSDVSVAALAQGCPLLEWVLFCEGAKGLTDATVYALAQHCTKLQGVRLTAAVNITEPSVLYLYERCRRLRSLSVPGHVLSAEAKDRIQHSTGRPKVHLHMG